MKEFRKTKIGNYRLGQTVSLLGHIEGIDVESMHDIENTTNLRINTGIRTIHVNPKLEGVEICDHQPKPEVPKFVAEWYEKHKEVLESSIVDTIRGMKEGPVQTEFDLWFLVSKESIQTLINMHQFGYTVKKEKLYTVEIPNNGGSIVLAYINNSIKLVDGNKHMRGKFIKESISSAGFGWVFDCSGVKVVEVDEDSNWLIFSFMGVTKPYLLESRTSGWKNY